MLHLAEILLSLVFVFGGFATLRAPHARAEQLARFRLPFPTLLVRLNGALMVAAGLCLALNVAPVLASVVLAIVLVPTTVFGHAFWIAEGAARQEQLAHFIKNVAVLGGLVATFIAAG
jgi:putative oxidoreductase